MSFRPLNTHVSLVIYSMILAPAACASQAPDPVRFSKVMVISDNGATIQLVADICQGQPYTTVVKESAELVSIQLLGRARLATLLSAAQTSSRFNFRRLSHLDKCTTRRRA